MRKGGGYRPPPTFWFRAFTVAPLSSGGVPWRPGCPQTDVLDGDSSSNDGTRRRVGATTSHARFVTPDCRGQRRLPAATHYIYVLLSHGCPQTGRADRTSSRLLQVATTPVCQRVPLVQGGARHSVHASGDRRARVEHGGPVRYPLRARHGR